MGMGLLPSEIYNAIFINAHLAERPARQLQLELLRDGLIRNFGWKCDHPTPKVKFSRKARIWYCSGCGTLFQTQTGTKGALVRTPISPTWEYLQELEQQTATPMGPLNQDMR